MTETTNYTPANAVIDAGATEPVAPRMVADPRILLDILRRRLWVFLIVAGAVIAAAIFYVSTTPKTYLATSAVQVEAHKGDVVQPTGASPPEVAPSADFIDTQILIIQSPENAQRVVNALGLAADPELGIAGSDARAGSAEEQKERSILSAATLSRHVTVRRVGQTAIIEINVTSHSSGQAARIANAYASQYLSSLEQSRVLSDARMNQLVDTRAEQLRRDARQSDDELQRYKIAHNLMSSEGATMAEQETSTLNQQIAAARSALAERQGRLAAAKRQLSAGGGGSDVSSAINSGTIGALRQQEADSSRNLAQLRSRYGPKHPSVAQEEQRLADTKRQIQNEIDRILSSLVAEVNVAQSGLNSLLQSQGTSKARLAGNAAAQVGYADLDRRATAAKTVYETFLNSSRGTAARNGMEPPIATLSSAAVEPSAPSSPNVLLIYLLSGIFALLAGIGAVALVEFLDGGLKSRADVERRLGVRYLGAVPELGSTLDGGRKNELPADYILSHPMSAFAESLRNLRAAITLRGHRPPKVIAIASALPLEGKTTTAICLARTFAMAGAKTVLVDADLRRHAASDLMLEGREGQLHEVLTGTLKVGSALLQDTQTDLMFLGSATPSTDGRDLLAPELLQPLLTELRLHFDYIIIDTAPVLGIADARGVAQQADATLLLARWRKTSMRATDAALELLLNAEAKVAGVALTLVDVRKFGSSGQEDLYGYHHKFAGYYTN